MKFPARFYLLAIFALFISVFTISKEYDEIIFYRHLLKEDSGTIIYLREIIIVCLMLSAGIWNFISAFFWIIRSRFSYTFLYTSAIALTAMILSWLIRGYNYDLVYVVVLAVLSVYIIILIIVAILPKTGEWVKQQGPILRTMVNPYIIAMFILLYAAGLASVFILNSTGKYARCEISKALASSQQNGNTAQYAVDNLYDTGWSPWTNPSGINEWIELKLTGNIEIRAIDIYPGANQHYDITMFKKYNRIKSGYIIFSDGTKVLFDLKDSAETQRIEFKPHTTDSIRLVVSGIFRGSEADTLHVSHIEVLKKVDLLE